MKCIIIEDEPIALDIIAGYISKTSFLELEAKFRDPVKALEFLKTCTVDLIFLDINMPELDGIRFLRSIDNRPMVIFTTAYSEYALESYEFNAVDYLLKPVEYERFLKAAGRAFEQFKMKEKYEKDTGSLSLKVSEENIFFIKSGTEYFKVKIGDIIYIRGMGNYIIFVTKNKDIISIMNLKDVSDKLPESSFVQVHKSYIVNLIHIDVIKKDSIKINNEFLPIGKVYKESLLKAIGNK